MDSMKKEQTEPREKRPNILFLITDDQRYGTIHALGNEEIRTPNMDRLVYGGTSFINAHIPGGTVSAVCMPSRAMLHSGRTLFHLEECGKQIPADHITMCQNFLEAGYHTAGIGKWHNGLESYGRSFDGGANIFFGGMWDHWNVPVNDFREDGLYNKEIRFTPNFTQNEVPVNVRAERIHAGVHSTDLFTDSAVKYIEEYEDDAPFSSICLFWRPTIRGQCRNDSRTCMIRRAYPCRLIICPCRLSHMGGQPRGGTKIRKVILAVRKGYGSTSQIIMP